MKSDGQRFAVGPCRSLHPGSSSIIGIVAYARPISRNLHCWADFGKECPPREMRGYESCCSCPLFIRNARAGEVGPASPTDHFVEAPASALLPPLA